MPAVWAGHQAEHFCSKGFTFLWGSQLGAATLQLGLRCWLRWQRISLQCRRQRLIPELGRSPGEENGNPLQYSCLENPMDRGIWQATVHSVSKSRTQLKRLTLSHFSPTVLAISEVRSDLTVILSETGHTNMYLRVSLLLYCELMVLIILKLSCKLNEEIHMKCLL